MAELRNKDKIRSELVPVIQALIDDTFSAAQKAGRSLRAAVMFGSVTGKDFIPGKSDVNIFMVFDATDINLLDALRPVFDRHFKKLKARPVVVDSDFVGNSSDVFPMEFLEWKERSLAVFGENPLDAIEISFANLRHQIEENIRGKRLRLVQSYFEIGPKPAKLQPFIEETLPNFLAVFGNIVRLAGRTPQRDAGLLFDEVERVSGVTLKSIRELQNVKKGRTRLREDELKRLFEGYIAELKQLILYVDKIEA